MPIDHVKIEMPGGWTNEPVLFHVRPYQLGTMKGFNEYGIQFYLSDAPEHKEERVVLLQGYKISIPAKFSYTVSLCTGRRT